MTGEPSLTARPRRALTLGPVLFNWEAEIWRDFYLRIADEAPVDRVCVGEVVCSKRLPFHAVHLAEVVERLRRAGKAVVLSSAALVTLPRERRLAAELAADGSVEIEINDLTLLAHLDGDRSFAVGPLVNVYNEDTLAFLAHQGARHVCLPPELPLDSIAAIAGMAGDLGVTIEVWSFGRLPLAISGRCYHARLHGLTKDNCRFVCAEDPDGLDVDTLDNERFLAVNGVQTLSFAHASLIGDLDRLDAVGVGSFRLSPHTVDMVAVAELFRARLDGGTDAAAAAADLTALLPGAHFANGFLDGPCGAAYTPA